MAQHDYIILDDQRAAVRADFNNALAAIGSNNADPIQPPSRAGGMFWFDTTAAPGKMKVRNKQNTTWTELPMGLNLLPLTGGTITGPLIVQGIFSNPAFDAWRGAQIGNTAPTSPVAGMLWYDTSVTPNVIRVRNAANNAWVVPQATVAPSFAESVTVTSPTGTLASVDLEASSEHRQIVNDSASSRLAFYAKANFLAAYFTDAGDLWLASKGSVNTALAALQSGKMNTLTDVLARSVGGPLYGLKWSGGTVILTKDGVDQGVIYTSNLTPPLPLPERGDVGAYALVGGVSCAIGIVSAGFSYASGYNARDEAAPGSWRVMGGGTGVSVNGLAQRVA